MANTGYRAWASLEQYFVDTGESTGKTKPNVSGDPDYVAPVYNEGLCPVADVTNPTVGTLSSNGTPTQTTIYVKWTAASDNVGVQYYGLYYKETSSGTWITISETIPSGTLTYNKGQLDAGKSYDFRMRARDEAGNWSSYSNTYTTTTADANSISVSPTTLSTFAHTDPVSGSVYVTANYGWSVTNKPSWITCTPSSASGSGSMSISTTNNTGSYRSGTITLTSGSATATIEVSQYAYVANTLEVSPTSLSFVHGGESKTFGVTSNTTWSVSDNQAWITVSGASGSGNDSSITVTCTSNSGSARYGTVTVTGGGITRTVSISQAAYVASLTQLTLKSSGASRSVCTSSTVTVYGDGGTLNGCNAIYSDSNGNFPAMANYYADNFIWRYWDGSSFTTSGSCAPIMP